MLSCFMVSGLSALGFAPNAPATGHPVCKLVIPVPSNGNSYPFSFQSLANHSSPSSSNGAPLISFIFIALRTLSTATRGYTPSFTQSPPRWAKGLFFSRPPLASISSISCHPSHFPSTTYKMLLPQLLSFHNHPFSWGCTPAPSLSRAHLSPTRSSRRASVPLWLTSSRRFRPHCHVSLTGPGGLSILMGFGKT
jgi:hypothetical protein